MIDQPHFWLGVLASAIDEALYRLQTGNAVAAETNLREALQGFAASPVPSPELVARLQEGALR